MKHFTERSVNVQKKMEERSTLLPVPSAVLMYCGLFLLWDRHRLLSVPKGPKSLSGIPLFEESLMTDREEKQVFHGSAKEAISILPTKVNVAIAASLASSGPENVDMSIFSVPEMVGDDHKITAQIPGVKAELDIYSSTSAIAGWSVVAVLRNLVSPIVF